MPGLAIALENELAALAVRHRVSVGLGAPPLPLLTPLEGAHSVLVRGVASDDKPDQLRTAFAPGALA